MKRELIWQNVPNVRKKSVLLRRRGKWLAEKTRVASEPNSQSDFINAAEKPSDQC